jgi:hypothetical protein
MSDRRHAWLVAMVVAIACGTEDGDDATTMASAGTGDTGTETTASTSPTTSATTSPTNPSTTMPLDTGETDVSDDGPLDTGPLDTGEATTSADTGEDTMADDGTGAATSGGPSDDTGALDTCLEMAVDACEQCACNNCLAELTACQEDPGCVEIRTCAQQAGCTGVGCLGPCGDVINANGGPLGQSAGLASALSDCYEGACANC